MEEESRVTEAPVESKIADNGADNEEKIEEKKTADRDEAKEAEDPEPRKEETEDGHLGRPSTPPNLFCRICHERDLPLEKNISPCFCKGTLSLVHESCLREWLIVSDSDQCELCGFHFQTQRIPKYSVVRSVWHWVSRSGPEQRPVLRSTVSLVLDLPLILSSNYLWFSKADSILQTMDHLMTYLLPYSEDSQLFNECMALAGQTVNLLLLCPLGILTGSHLMLYLFRLLEHSLQWYSWHRRQTTLILTIPSSQHQ